MEAMKKSALHKAVVLAMTTTALVACGSSSDDNNDESAKRPSSISKVLSVLLLERVSLMIMFPPRCAKTPYRLPVRVT